MVGGLQPTLPLAAGLLPARAQGSHGMVWARPENLQGRRSHHLFGAPTLHDPSGEGSTLKVFCPSTQKPKHRCIMPLIKQGKETHTKNNKSVLELL